MDDYLLEEFKYRDPYLYEQMAECEMYGKYALLVTLVDGRHYIYDSFTKVTRRLPTDKSNMTEDECKREFKYRLYHALDSRGMTQTELCRRAGISQPQLSRYMTGKAMPSFYVVDRIAKALGCSIDDFRYW